MNTPKILMFHGKEGSPNGRKASFLKSKTKYQTWVPAYPSNEGPVEQQFPKCVSIARQACQDFAPDIIVGSSFGGAVLLQLVTEGLWQGPSLFLAQAGAMYGIADTLPHEVPCILVHGTQDNIVPIEGSERLALSSPNARLIKNNDNHSLVTLCDGLFDLCLDYLLLQK